jgi:hypothetical protein
MNALADGFAAMVASSGVDPSRGDPWHRVGR